ncbi:MAG TPA: gliding motility-associated C-terminal domain-containing protein [Chitinophaga sp.]|uniref:Ig-like domain-containing protein n=1 Tax=Chitinophaga sp. TaxID=1869181 RepID=UPI002DBE97D6|nr:gliding motility-associated C-terminal domain-containing protein [Chitinophaga sp.]HEU4553000.1 gliding motility-associated C-terminal domain-containing protein [Chitinophaga sp.]
MRKFIFTQLLKIAPLCCCLLLLAARSTAQTDISIGTGTTGNGSTFSYPCPLQDYYEGSRAQYLFRAAELTAAGMGPGMITAIKFNVTDLNDAGVVEQYALKIATTTLSTLGATTWEPTGSPVYGPADYQPVTGVNTFAFTTGFFWNGTDNIIVEACNGGDDWTANPTIPWTTGLSFNASRSYVTDNQGSLCGTTTTSTSGTATTRPNIIFTWTPASACTGTPNGGTAVASVSSVCLNESFNLSLTGATVASGLKYQWQSSANNTTWTNIPNDTTSGITATQPASTYYRCMVTCTNTGLSAPSASVFVASPTLVAGNFFINKANPTDPAGTHNFNSFNDAYNYIKCGINGPVVFDVVAGSGTYNEQLNMLPVPGASATNTITFNGNGQTLSYTSANGSQRAVIKLDGADHIQFNNLVITAGGSTSSEYGFGMQLLNDADSNTVNNCTININTTSSSTNYAGIVISASATSATGTGEAKCDGNTFSNNTITGGYYGVTMVGNSNFANGNNRFTGNTIKDFYYYGFYISYSFNALISGNTITRPARTDVNDFYGVYLTNLNTKDSISKNRFTDPFGGDPASTDDFYGVYLTSVDALSSLENIVSNNLMYNITGSGSVYAFYNSSSDNVYYYHNTLALDGSASGSSYVTRGFYFTSSRIDGINFINNIITISRSGPGQKHALYFGNTTSTVVSDRNDLFIAPGVTNAFTGYFSANQATLANWQAASTQDAGSLASNPMYASTSTGNYSPVNASIDNRGMPAGVTTDINNTARSATTPDIGAYEFTPPPCTVPPTPGTATVGATPVCVNSRVALGLTGNSVGLTQTYQWQVGAAAAGPFTNLGGALTNPDTIIVAGVTSYYRVAVTCSGNTAYSTPVLLTVTQALPGDTYTIDKNAPASTPKNYQSFAAAKSALECGIAGPVVFNVVAGRTPYNEQLILDSIPGASAINTVTFKGNGNTIAFSSDNTDERAVIKLRRTDHVTFDSLKIDATGAGSYGYGVQLISNADSNTIRKCEIITDMESTSSGYAGIVINADEDGATGYGATLCDANVIDHNTVTGGYYGITLVGDEDMMLLNNRITNNLVKDFYSSGIRISYTTNTLVEGNSITRPARTNSSYTLSGINTYEASNKLLITRNRIFNAYGADAGSTDDFHGLYIQYTSANGGAENLVTNNIVYNINHDGYIYGINNYYTDNTYYYHNTVSLDNAASTATGYTRGFYVTGDVAGVRCFDNIITITRGGTGNKTGIYVGTSNADFTSDYNDVYVQGGGSQNYFGYYGGNQATLADWKANTFQDGHSISMDPVYADMPNGNLAPVIAPLDNTGTPEGVAIDIQGTARSTTTPDMGAFEISIPPCVAPPNAGTAVANPDNNICMGSMVDLTLTGNTTGGGQTYLWQAAKTTAGPWHGISETRYVKEFRTELTMENYFRCLVVCGGDTAYSVPAHVNMNAPLMSGNYTIDPSAPVSTTNFQSFTQAVAALDCGIAGWVTFNVVPGTYMEQVRMHRIPGATDTSRVTFRSSNHAAGSVTLTFAGTSTDNYVLQLDSANYVTYKEITIKSTGSSYARAIELAHTTSYDSIANCIIEAPAVTSSGTDKAAIYADDFKGTDNVIKGNTVKNGSSGIYISGTSSSEMLPNMVIDSNTVTGAYQYSIYTYYTSRIKVNKNTINITAPRAGTSYGIYTGYADTAFEVTHNAVNISNTTSTVYGIYTYYSDGTAAYPGNVSANRIKALNGNTGTLYGIGDYYSSYIDAVNNVVSIKTTGSNAYGLYAYGGENIGYYNNSIQSASTATGTNAAAYFSPGAIVRTRNNIFSHTSGGTAMTVTGSLNDINSDYNTLYTSGTTLIHLNSPNTDYANLQDWRDDADLDVSSIVYKPAFTDDSTLMPAIDVPDVWAIHGRGVQVPGNDHDINNQPRPVTLIGGVPDMGAYEFLPTVLPPVLPAVPAAPAPGITQTFMFGTDTVTKITWGPNAPDTVAVRRYSGVIPPKVDTSKEFMYFYTAIAAGPQPYSFDVQQFYVDSWQGRFNKQSDIRLGRTIDTSNTWVVNDSSTVQDIYNIIADTTLNYLNKFTGLKGHLPDPPAVIQPADSSNRGTRFWVGYGHHQFFTSDNSQEMVLYLNAEDSANVTVRINGTSWEKQYHIPANTVITSDLIPKGGLSDARLLTEGLSDKGISITSDVPIVAYAHIYGSASSGATMLLPVGTYAYDYYTLGSKQYYSTNTYSWFYVIADYDNTVVEITPSNPTLAGRAADVPFTVTLNKGEVYQVLGALKSGSEGYDLSGSHVKSVSNSAGKCYPVAVFSGSSRTAFSCTGTGGSGDNFIQQNFPSQAWGKNYLTAPTSTDDDPATFMTNVFRVLVKDTATVVKRNGVPLTGLINKRYYEYTSDSADYIQADQPIMVAQFMSSSGGCDNTSGLGDPETIYLSPIEQGINKVGLYRNTQESIDVNYLTLIIPTAGVSSLLVDGANTFDHVYAHPNLPGYTVVIKRWDADEAQCIVTSDSAFTAITYGLGSVESYGYNAGTLVKNLNSTPSFNNVYDSSGIANDYTCAKTPFRFSMLLTLKPTKLTWQFSKVANLSSNADVVQQNPVPVDSSVVNGRKYFRYVVDSNYVFSQPGTYYVPIVMTHPEIESCNNSLETILPIKVIAAPVVDFSVAFSGCVGNTAQFRGTATTANGVGIASWKWQFGDSDTSIVQDPLKKYNAPGTYNVKLNIIAAEGCIGDTTKPVTVNAAPAVSLVKDTLIVCAGSNVTFEVQNPDAAATYNWYSAATGGTLLGSGTMLTIPGITASNSYYAEAVKDGCTGTGRKRAYVTVFPQLATPVVEIDTIGVNMIRFKWAAVPNATGYEVSTDNGMNWSEPSSGPNGLTHTISGLQPTQEVALVVKAKGCEDKISDPVSGKTLPDGIFIPNAFSPNGDGLNDELRVYGYIIKEIHFMIFNQWGEKVFETNMQSRGWDGMYKGKMQPSGVYIYVCKLQLTDGTTIEKKGAINLIR